MASSVKYLKRMLSIDSIGTHEYGRAKNITHIKGVNSMYQYNKIII